MNHFISIFRLLLVLAVLSSCSDNEIMPAYEKKGTATSTVATLASSNTRPPQGTDITLTLTYVNPASDPLQTIELKAKVGSGAYTTVQTITTTSDPLDAQSTKTVTYTTPNVAGTVTFDMVITSQRPYPQVVRSTVTVQ